MLARFSFVVAQLLAMWIMASAAYAQTALQFGTYQRPFAPTSPWNSRPVNPTFGTFVIPTSQYVPAVSGGQWSTGVFLAKQSDPAVTVYGLPNTAGVWDPDSGVNRTITIPRWPADVQAATASDGHADIVDPVSNIIHSFWQLRYQNGKWMAAQYAWSPLNGRGWGDPAHFFQGARAAGVPTSAGIIRKHEINDGDTMYRHALAMSLTFNALSPSQTYVYPATSADTNAASTNTGQIPEGALMMLPPTYDTSRISSAALRKVAETLKTYGAYVVDRNTGTPFYIYVENKSGFDLHNGGWNNAVATELDRIRASLRQVTSAQSWVDGNGKTFTPPTRFNLLSMRGPWYVQSGSATGNFDTWQQAVVFPNTATRTVQVNNSSRSLNPVSWSRIQPGKNYRISAIATGGAKLRFQVRNANSSQVYFDSGELANGESKTFAWPTQTDAATSVYAISGVNMPSTVRGELIQQE